MNVEYFMDKVLEARKQGDDKLVLTRNEWTAWKNIIDEENNGFMYFQSGCPLIGGLPAYIIGIDPDYADYA